MVMAQVLGSASHGWRRQPQPSVRVHVGALEALQDDSMRLAERTNAKESRTTVKVFPGMWHVWQTLGGRMRKADQPCRN